MFQELVNVLRELVEPVNAGYIQDDRDSDRYCDYCGEYNHTPDCPITRARNLLTEVDAMSKAAPLPPDATITPANGTGNMPRGTKTIITGG